MGNKKEKLREQRREQRRQKSLLKDRQAEVALEDEMEDISGDEPEVVDEVEKSYDEPMMAMPMPGATSFDELDAIRKLQEKEEHVQEVAWDVKRLVSNILYSPTMTPRDKAAAIKSVGNEFGVRVEGIVGKSPIAKDLDIELLEVEALMARDGRHFGVIEKLGDWLAKNKFTAAVEGKLEDDQFALVVERDGTKVRQYPIHDKPRVRNALARAAQMMKAGGEAAADAKAALPKIKAAAKSMGIGMDEKSLDSGSILIEKDATGQWRWVGMPSNNFLDFQGDIISKDAHEEYVAWVNANPEFMPLSMSWHIPESVRKHTCDYVGYEHGFLIASGPLEESEAIALMELQKETDLGMSLGGFALARDMEDSRVITQYRALEFSDLPLEKAANPFTSFEALSKEAKMDKNAYLEKVLGPERAQAFLAKAGATQEALRTAGVTEKELGDAPAAPADAAVTPPAAPDAPAAVSLEDVLKALDSDGLSAWVAKANEDLQKVPVLEGVIQDLVKEIGELRGNREDALAKMIQPPAAAKFAWSGQRPSQSAETLAKEGETVTPPGIPDDDEHWLSKQFNIAPLQPQAAK